MDGTRAADVDLSRARVEGDAVRSLVLSGSKLVVELDAEHGSDVAVRTEGGCAVRLSSKEVRAGGTVERFLSPWLDFGGAPAAVGFGGVLEFTARPGCPEAGAGKIAWTQTSGSPLRDVHAERNGYHFFATMPGLAESLGGAPPWGIVPISPRTRGEVELRATWSNGGATVTETLRASAAARSHGLPNVALGARVYLGGDGWRLQSAPPGSRTRRST